MTIRNFAGIIASALVALSLAACAGSAPMTAPASSNLPHKQFTEADLVGKTLHVPKGADNSRYDVTFRGDGTFTQVVRAGANSATNFGKWRITPNGDVYVMVKRGATLSFYGPAASGAYVYVNPNNPKSGTPWVTID